MMLLLSSLISGKSAFNPSIATGIDSWVDERLDAVPPRPEVDDWTSENFRWRFETVNTTCTRSLKSWMLKTQADVLLVQEPGLLPHKQDDFACWAKKRGWRIECEPSVLGETGRPTAGALIAVRGQIGIARVAAGCTAALGRLCIAYIHLLGWPRILVGSVYLVTGASLKPCNRSILAAWAGAVEAAGCLAILGGDLQMPKKVIDLSGYPAKLGAIVVPPPEGKATCVTGSASTHIDLFMCRSGLLALPHNSDVFLGPAVATHRPHYIDFPRAADTVCQLVFDTPARLPTVPLVGPKPRPQDWCRAKALVEAAVTAAAAAPAVEAEKLLNAACAGVANTAEAELADIFGVSLRKQGARGGTPKLRWRKVLRDKVELPAAAEWQHRAEFWQWLAARLAECTRLLTTARRNGLVSPAWAMLEQHCVDAQVVSSRPRWNGCRPVPRTRRSSMVVLHTAGGHTVANGLLEVLVDGAGKYPTRPARQWAMPCPTRVQAAHEDAKSWA